MNISQISDICTGCGSCVAVCPSAAIRMQPDEHGFLHPAVDAAACTDCGLCACKCPVSTPPQVSAHTEILTGYANDEALLPASSSGAISQCWPPRSSAVAVSCSARRSIKTSTWHILPQRAPRSLLRFAAPNMYRAAFRQASMRR